MKRITILSFFLTLTIFSGRFAVSAAAAEADAVAMPAPSRVEIEIVAPQSEVTLQCSGRNVRVMGASGQSLEVYSITGAKVATYAIDANDKSITLNLHRGWYILKVGNVTRKVSIL